jgi:hypothetical protein
VVGLARSYCIVYGYHRRSVVCCGLRPICLSLSIDTVVDSNSVAFNYTTVRNNMTRLEANRQILEILSKEIELQPDVRFTQLLYNLKIVDFSLNLLGGLGLPTFVVKDEYNLESEELLNRLNITKTQE